MMMMMIIIIMIIIIMIIIIIMMMMMMMMMVMMMMMMMTIAFKGAIENFFLLTAPRAVSNKYAQVARALSCANHVQHIGYHLLYVVLRATFQPHPWGPCSARRRLVSKRGGQPGLHY